MSRIRSTRRWVVALAASTALLAGVGLAAPLSAGAASDPTLTEAYDAVGTSHIGSINSDLPISPTTLTATLDLNTFAVLAGTLPIAPQVVSFQALGFIPIRGLVTLTQATPISGSLTPTDKGNVLVAKVGYTINIKNLQVQVFGAWVPLFVGNNCQTISPAMISVASPKGRYFDIADGGTATGTYTIGQFKNCAPLMLPDVFGIGSLPINSLVPGTNNTVTLHISNGRFVSST